MKVADSRFSYLKDLVFDHSGILLGDDQEYLLEARLGPIARDLGLLSGADVVETVQRDGSSSLANRVVEAMVTGETSWFRDLNPFETLRAEIIPEIMTRRRPTGSLAIWSAACSTGQELYSIAMMLDSDFPETFTWDVNLLGTDLSYSAVRRAAEGHYTALEMNRGLPAAMLAKYFVREGAGFRISDFLRTAVRFETLNLVHDPMPIATFDVIFLRNVLIYFDAPLKKKVLAAAWSRLRDGGYLFLGSTETALGLTEGIMPPVVSRTIGGVTYYRRELN